MLLTGIFSLLLPETLNMRLAETIDEAGVFEKATETLNELHDNKNDSQLQDIKVGAHENTVSIGDEGV